MFDTLIQWIKDSIESLKPWVIINTFERGVAISFGKFTRVLQPGIHWIVPFGFTDVFVDNVVWRTTDLGVQSLMTKDQRTITLRAVVTSRIKNIEKAILEVEGVDDALKDACSGAIGQYVSTTTSTGTDRDTISNTGENLARSRKVSGRASDFTRIRTRMSW